MMPYEEDKKQLELLFPSEQITARVIVEGDTPQSLSFPSSEGCPAVPAMPFETGRVE
jgi:hypothetical protein